MTSQQSSRVFDEPEQHQRRHRAKPERLPLAGCCQRARRITLFYLHCLVDTLTCPMVWLPVLLELGSLSGRINARTRQPYPLEFSRELLEQEADVMRRAIGYLCREITPD